MQIISNSDMAAVYGDDGPILEQHHVRHTMRILSSPQCDILAGLSKSVSHNERVDKQYHHSTIDIMVYI